MKITALRLAEFAAATVISSAVLLVSITPALFGTQAGLGEARAAYPPVSVAALVGAPERVSRG